MSKPLTFISLIFALTFISCQSSIATSQPKASQKPVETLPPMQLPSDNARPNILPATIIDPILLEGWVRLHNSTRTCQLWDGYTITGQELAQYVIDQDIVITWNTNTIYSGSWIGSWVDRDQTRNVYLNPMYKEYAESQMIDLVGEMAHEIFHDALPFEQSADTLYEEYWAFYIEACVSGQSTERFQHAYPLSEICLTQWFQSNLHAGYLDKYDVFPENVKAISKP